MVIEYLLSKTENRVDKNSTVRYTMTMVEGYLPSQLQFFTSLVEREVPKGIANSTDMVLMGINKRIPFELFQNGSPISLLIQMWNI